ncbi:MAG: hypothetical protein AAGI45_13860 [Cyanobacteria bacterium P01_H01_bin.26]
MVSSTPPKVSLVNRIQRLWAENIAPLLTLGVALLVFAVSVGNGLLQEAPAVNRSQDRQPAVQTVRSSEPRLDPSGPQLHHRRRVTEAAMTSHDLTSAHLLTRRLVKSPPADTNNNANRG